MSMKRNLLASATLLAIAGTTATAVLVHETPAAIAAHTAAGASSQASPAAASANARAFAGINASAPQLDSVKQAAVARAEALLRQRKTALAAAAGRNASAQSLAAESYTPRDAIVEADGSEHVRLARSYRGLPVVGGDLVVHSRDGQWLSSSATLDLQVPDDAALRGAPTPNIAPDRAVAAARANFATAPLADPALATVYFADANRPKLAYQVHLTGLGDDGIPVDDLIYIDADNAQYLGRKSNVLTVAAQGDAFTLNRGKVKLDTSQVTAAENPGGAAGFLLTDEKRGKGQTRNFEGKDTSQLELVFAALGLGDRPEGKPFYDADNLWGDNQVDLSQRIGGEVHYGVAKTWDYYLKQHDRHGIYDDGVGVVAVANITNFATFTGSTKTNAFWYTPLKSMYYLNGEAGVSNPVIALDVAGHEMSHGVAAATAAFLGSGEPVGLNEANSDINGTLVEFFDNNPKDPPDYLIGESVMQDGKPFRYMFKPSLDRRTIVYNGKDEEIGSYDCYPQGGFDYSSTDRLAQVRVDSHFTSGIGNHFFYLLSEGAKVPASHKKTLAKDDLVCNGNTKLLAIGNKTAGQIWYRALRLYMTEQTNYPLAREATQQAAADLLDRGLLSKKQANAVACAWEAVSVPLPAGSAQPACG